METWLRRYSHNKYVLPFSVAVVFVGFIVAYLSWYHGTNVRSSTLISFRPTLFPNEWYNEDILKKMLTIDLFAVWCGLPLGTAIWIFLTNARFLYDIKRIPVIPIPIVLLTKLRGITNLYLFAAFTWYVGVALFALLLLREFGIVSITVVIILMIIGFSMFFLPQYIFHGFLVRAYNDIADGMILVYRQRFMDSDPDAGRDFEAFSDMVEFNEPGQLWVYDLSDIMILLLGQLIVLGSGWRTSIFRMVMTSSSGSVEPNTRSLRYPKSGGYEGQPMATELKEATVTPDAVEGGRGDDLVLAGRDKSKSASAAESALADP